MSNRELSNVDWIELLEKDEIRQSLQILLEKLPQFVDAILSVEQLLEVATVVLKDKQTTEQYIQKLEGLNINVDTIEALLQLIEKLPVLMKWLSKAEEVGTFAEAVVKDEQSLASLKNSVEELINPAKGKAQEGVSLLTEVKQRAESSQGQISIFTIMRWLKDPTVQKTLSYVQAFLEVSAKRA
ncbi:hypothetical protein LC040_02025 [Bacillus tianshenii]|nr:hypothetical protein LC040_02025 [Bacillus tianshenii]